VDLRGTVNGDAPFTITGQINPLAGDAFTDLQVQFKAINLKTTSPYAGKYVGFPIEKGALSLGLKYRLNKNELTAENLIEFDQLTLGEATGSTNAPKLPVKLALALLTDVNGMISLDVPVRGNLNDPKFKIGKVILQVFMNILTKAATAPFALLGSLVGGGEDFSYVAFKPGLTRLELKETKKLDSLAKALKQRPRLKLGIAGSFDPVEDRIAFARVLFREGANTKDLAKGAAELPNDREQKAYAQKIKDAFPKAAGMPTESPEERRLRAAGKRAEQKVGAREKETEKVEAAPKDVPFEEMERKVLETVSVPEAELAKLAAERGKLVEEYLVQKAGMPTERASLVGSEVKDANAKPRCGVNLLLQ
jgi:outer membrane protein OmpA-like peptidoglycan-associated protein